MNGHQLKHLMEEHGDAVLRTAYLYLQDHARAEDAYQEVFLKAYRSMDAFRGESSLKTWLLQITINHCKDQLKSGWLRRVLIHFSPNSEATDKRHPELLAVENESRHELFQQVLHLSLPLREVIILHYYHDLEIREIAAILSVADGTVKSRLHRARRVLKENLEKTGGMQA